MPIKGEVVSTGDNDVNPLGYLSLYNFHLQRINSQLCLGKTFKKDSTIYQIYWQAQFLGRQPIQKFQFGLRSKKKKEG